MLHHRIAGIGSFGVGSIVGILVYLDGANAFQSWDGEMVNAHVTFSINGRPISSKPQQNQAPLVGDPLSSSSNSNSSALPPLSRHRSTGVSSNSMHSNGNSMMHNSISNTSGAMLNGGGSGVHAMESSSTNSSNNNSSNVGPPALANGLTRSAPAMRAAIGPDGSSVQPFAVALPKDGDLFPTLTLLSPNTQVFCRFCAADLVQPSRASIGAPAGVTVYALDGSLVLGRDQ